MRKFFLSSLATAALALSALTPSGAEANLLVNGSFETGDLTGWSFTGNTGFTAVTTGGYGPEDGSWSVFEGPVGSDGLLSQTFADTAGQQLTASGWVAGNGYGYSDFNMSINGVTYVSIGSPVPNQPYTEYSFTFTGTGSDTLTIGFRNDPSFDGLDNFSVTAGVPELGTWAMMIIGFGGVGLQMRRRAGAMATAA